MRSSNLLQIYQNIKQKKLVFMYQMTFNIYAESQLWRIVRFLITMKQQNNKLRFNITNWLRIAALANHSMTL